MSGIRVWEGVFFKGGSPPSRRHVEFFKSVSDAIPIKHLSNTDLSAAAICRTYTRTGGHLHLNVEITQQ